MMMMIVQKSCHLLDLLTTQSATRSRHFLTGNMMVTMMTMTMMMMMMMTTTTMMMMMMMMTMVRNCHKLLRVIDLKFLTDEDRQSKRDLTTKNPLSSKLFRLKGFLTNRKVLNFRFTKTAAVSDIGIITNYSSSHHLCSPTSKIKHFAN